MKAPRIKEILFATQRKNHRILLGTPLYGSGVEIQDDDEDTIWQLMRYMDGSRSIPEVIVQMQKVHPDLDDSTIADAIEELINQGFVEDAGAPLPENISPDEADRYSRNAQYFAWVDRKKRSSPYEVQSILKKSRVTVIGVGAIGGSVAFDLTLMGVGSIHLVDFDRVILSNVTRQVLYKEADVGRKKIEAAAESLRKHNSTIAITTQDLRVNSQKDMHSLFRDTDLVILNADRPYDELRAWANTAALASKIPWIESCSGGPQYAVSLFVPWKTPCHTCAMHFAALADESFELIDPSIIDKQPTIPPAISSSTAIAANFVALQACYFLIGIKPYVYGRVFRQNLLVLDHFITSKGEFWIDCPDCGANSPYRRKGKNNNADNRADK